MTGRIERLRKAILEKEHHALRQGSSAMPAFRCTAPKGSPQAAVQGLAWVLGNEKPVFLPGERIVLTRTVPQTPSLSGLWNNCPEFAHTIAVGLSARRVEALESLETQRALGHAERVQAMQAVVDVIDCILEFCARYQQAALDTGRPELADVFASIPEQGARSFLEALQFFRLLNYVVKADNKDISPLGRLDQILWPYLEADYAAGVQTEASALELLEEFFLSLNRDSDLYGGVQLGDNGQSIVLGGVDETGRDSWNPLSDLCLEASFELRVIDPKINMRVCKTTPHERLVRASRLTAQGLGFPQYSNDDVVIPALLRMGYSPADAFNYTVAACWEFIIPGAGLEIVNLDAMFFAGAAQRAVEAHLKDCRDFEALMEYVRRDIGAQVLALAQRAPAEMVRSASPLHTLLSGHAVGRGMDLSACPRYRNVGLHGPGLSTAADSLYAVKSLVFDRRELDAETLLEALEADYEGYEALCNRLRYDMPKLGQNTGGPEKVANELLAFFANACKPHVLPGGGQLRPGTGSSFYHTHGTETLPATADGRKAGEFIAANFSPSLQSKGLNPLDIVVAFAGLDIGGVMNGGPLTLELHDSVFRNPQGIEKTALLVELFIQKGGHQLQLNAVNRERLLDAQQNPGRYPGLIVRVWGWSGYFVELDRAYQDQIIRRAELSFQ